MVLSAKAWIIGGSSVVHAMLKEDLDGRARGAHWSQSSTVGVVSHVVLVAVARHRSHCNLLVSQLLTISNARIREH